MTDLRTAAQQALEVLKSGLVVSWHSQVVTDLEAALAQPTLQTCNCRWDGEVQVQQCTLHEAHVDAIHEWAERAKTAEKKLAAITEPVQEPDSPERRCGGPGCDGTCCQPVQEPAPMPPFPPVSLWKRGCAVCGIGAGGHAYGYACPRSDCPTRVTCGGAV